MAEGGRLLPLRSATGQHNMAVDQLLLEAVDRERCPTLRWYSWQEPTLSLGYFQALADRQLHPASTALDCVRRATGGGAIVHHHELTYCLALPDSRSRTGGRADLYRALHRGVADVLRGWGIRAEPFRSLGTQPHTAGTPFLCFQRRSEEDLVVAGYKILGSAQRRTQHAILQHGSLLLAASPFAPQLPGISDLRGRRITAQELIEPLSIEFRKVLGISAWNARGLSQAEAERVTEIEDCRFGHPSWLNRR